MQEIWYNLSVFIHPKQRKRFTNMYISVSFELLVYVTERSYIIMASKFFFDSWS